MPAKPPYGPAMDLDNMRENGATHVLAYCRCGHEAPVDVSSLPGSAYVPALKDRLRCLACGKRPMEVRPDWSKRTVAAPDPTRYFR